MNTPLVTLGAVNVEAANPTVLGEFYAAVTGGALAVSEETAFLPAVGLGGFAMFFQLSAGPRPEHNLIHLDLTVPWGSRASEVDRLESLGAERKWDVLDEVPHVQWTTMTDPEGNYLCVAEHPPADS